MANVNFKGLKKMGDDLKKSFASDKKRIGGLLIELMKNTIKVGGSPVRGVGRFIKYKDHTVYPANKKKRSPVNLWLNGDMLRSIKPDVRGGKLFIGITDSEQAGKLMTIQRGQTKNGKVKLAGPRPVFPLAEGSKFTVKIMRDLTKWYKDLVQKAVNKQR